jgi:NTE family protein
VLVVLAGDAAGAAWGALDVPAAHDVSVRLAPSAGLADLPRLLRQVTHEYDRILVLGESGMAGVEDGWQVVREGEHAASGANTAVITHRRWTQPALHALSQATGGRVLATLPPQSAPVGPRDPVAGFARVITHRRIGVALGAGAAKGFAHIGVLRAFEEFGVPVDMLSGCSIGAAVAAGYAAGYSIAELSEVASRIAARAVRPTLPLHSFLSNRGLRDELERVGRGRRFEDLDIPLAICATDVYRRCEVTFTTGLVWPRILASMAIPGIYPALKSSDSYFVDGSVLNPMPSRQCRELGAGIVIGVRLTGKNTSPRAELEAGTSRPLAPETIMRCLEIMHNRLSELSKHEADVNIEVCLERGGLRDFDHSAEIVQAGYDAAIESRGELLMALPYLAAAS